MQEGKTIGQLMEEMLERRTHPPVFVRDRL